MAEFQFTYTGAVDRQAKIADAEAQGLVMLHDDFDLDWKPGDEPHGTLTFTDIIPSHPEHTLPLSTHWAIVDSFHPAEVKPLRVKRTWNQTEYLIDCYVTVTVVQEYLAGEIAVGDFVLIHYLDNDVDRPVAFAKVYKTW